MLDNYKKYLFIIALTGTFAYIFALKIQNINLASKLQVCNANLAANIAAQNIANELRVNQERKIRLREREATQARVESQKRMELIMQADIKDGCEGANQFMIDQALQLQFIWNNNIP